MLQKHIKIFSFLNKILIFFIAFKKSSFNGYLHLIEMEKIVSAIYIYKIHGTRKFPYTRLDKSLPKIVSFNLE